MSSESSWSSFMIRFATKLVIVLLSLNIVSSASVSTRVDQSAAPFTNDGHRNRSETSSNADVSQHLPTSRQSYGTVDDYRNRIQSMFRLLENRPEQGCHSTRVYRFYCPTPHPQNPETGWVCIKIDDLCNNIPDCPGAEDEDPTQCMFYLAVQHQAYQLRTIIVNQFQQQQSRRLNEDSDF